MLQIPNKKRWIQANNSSVLGNLWATFNVDLGDNLGRLRCGSRLAVNISATDDADLGLPVAFGAVGGKKYAIAGSKVFVGVSTDPQSSFSEDVTSGVPTTLSSDYSDMKSFNGYLYVTSSTTTVYKVADDGSWSNFTAGVTTSSPRLLTAYGDRMYMTDGNSKIISWGTDDNDATIGSAYTLDFSSNSNERKITFLRSSASRIWIGTVNLNGGKGAIYEWDGISTQATRLYRLEASGALACVIKDDIPYVLDSNGNLVAWNGGSFQYMTGFNREKRLMLLNSITSTNDRFIHPNGMSLIDGRICILVRGTNSGSTTSIEETIPSGIYEYDKEYGLVHKHSFTLTKSDGTTSDFGQIKISKVGALSELNIGSDSATRNGTFLAGAQVYTNASSTLNIIAYDDSINSLQKAGYFITPYIDSPNVNEVWQKIYVKFKKFLSANDKLVVKYRTSESTPVEATITWSSTTQFTTTTSLASYAVGDEVQVIQGLGSGKPSHITALSESGGTYTVTVDETYTGATGTSKAKFDKWIKAGSLSNQVSTYLECPIGATANWVQFKVWFTLTGRKEEIEELLVVNAPNQKPL